MDSAPPVTRRSRLRREIEETNRLAALRSEVEQQIARFASIPVPFGTGSPYHAAQSTRLRQYTGESAFGIRPRPEEEMLRAYDRATIISRGRTMIRNNPWVAGIFLAYVQELGTPTYKSTANLGDPVRSAEYNDRRERFMERWARDCESGDDLSLDEVVEIWGYERVIAGEMFIVFLQTGELQLIPSELCGSATAGAVPPGTLFADGVPVPAGARERDGLIRVDGRVIGYRFGERDAETGGVDFSRPEGTTLVRRAYVRHLYDRDRIEQGRGVPATATILAKMQDLFETGDARSQQVKNAACLSMWITKNIDPYGFAEAMKGAMRGGRVEDAVALKTIAEQRSDYKELRAGSVYYGATGEDVKLIEPKLSSGDWHDHYIDLLQTCCNVLDNMPVEVGIEGFRASSYSSARGTMEKWKRRVGRRRKRTEVKLLDPAQLWQTRRAELFGDLSPIPATEQEECHWGWPAIPDIDGTKTAARNAVELANGSTTLAIVCAEKGLHADQVIRQRAAEKIEFVKELAARAARELGLTAEAALKWAMAAAPESTPALAAVLADALTSPAEPAPAARRTPAA